MRDYATKTYRLVIDFLIEKNENKRIVFSTRDKNTAFVNAELKVGDKIIDITEYDKIVAGFRKSDGSTLEYDCTILNSTNGEIEVPFTPEVLKSPGINYFDVMLIENETKMMSQKIRYRVEK